MQKSTVGFRIGTFQCPHCGVYAEQEWYDIAKGHMGEKSVGYYEGFIDNLSMNLCPKCEKYGIWLDGHMIYPTASIAPLPLPDMPTKVKELFSEGRNVVNASPRAAAALLRLALEHLMVHLGGKGRNINEDIAKLVGKGLPKKIRKALRAVRATGRSATQLGRIDPKDNAQTAIALFNLVNMIVDFTISQPKKVNALYTKLPLVEKKKRQKQRKKRKKQLRRWECIPKPTLDYR